MTAQRRETARWREIIAILLLAGCATPAPAATTERLVVNRHSGLAIDGFDPVAYFTDARPVRGQPALELSAAGAVWRFANAGNRAFFRAHPEIYGPQFGGFDPTDIARGVAYPGNPRVWMIHDARLYLFGRQDSRDAFAAAPARFLQEAARRWSDVQATLAR